MTYHNPHIVKGSSFFYNYFKKNGKLVISVYILIAIITSYNSCTDGGDFDFFLNAGHQILLKENIYDKGLLYSVFFATILSPFSTHVFITEFVWLMISFGLIVRIAFLILKYLDTYKLSEKNKGALLLLSFFMSIQFVMYEISLIQVTIFLLWGILESLQLIEKQKNIAGGMLLAIVINIKLMPLMILPYLFYRGYFKAITACILFFIVLLYLPAIFIGKDYNNYLLNQWIHTINPQNKENVSEVFLTTHSIVSLFTVYLTDTPIVSGLPYKRNFLNVSNHTLGIIINVTRVILLCISLFFLKSSPFRKEPNKTKMFWEISYFLLLIPLVFPHQNKYDFLLVLPMIIYLLYFYLNTYHIIRTFPYTVSLILFIIASLVYSPLYGSDLIGVFLFKFTQHFKLMTLSTFFLIPVAIFCNPQKLRVSSGLLH